MKKWSFAVLTINGYQRYVSPYKGFCCAYRVVRGGDSCSEFAKQAILQNGFWHSLRAIRKRFTECKEAAVYFNTQKEQEKKQRGESKKQGACQRSADLLHCIPMPCGEASGGFGIDACACSFF